MSGLIRRDFNTMFDSLFNDFFKEFEFGVPSIREKRTSKFSYPKWNIQDNEKDFTIEAAVPGLTKDDVKVEYVDGVLNIRGNKQNTTESGAYGHFLVRELHKSSFSRSIVLDEESCDISNINASVDEGLLKIKIPKKVLDKSKNKRIIEVE